MSRRPGHFDCLTDMNRALILSLVAAVTTLAYGTAHAAPAKASGASQALVVAPGSVVPLDALRFGQFMRPTTAGTLTIDIAGAATATGGVAGNQNIIQVGTGRGPGRFLLRGSPNRQTDITLPASITIANGAATMTVNTLTANINGAGKLKLDPTGSAVLIVGARLNVAANQAVGPYSGTYTITVAFQ